MDKSLLLEIFLWRFWKAGGSDAAAVWLRRKL